MNEVMRTAQINHNFLVKRLSSSEGHTFLGKWVAVAHRHIYTSGSLAAAMRGIKKIEPDRTKVLLVHIPKYKHRSLAF